MLLAVFLAAFALLTSAQGQFYYGDHPGIKAWTIHDSIVAAEHDIEIHEVVQERNVPHQRGWSGGFAAVPDYFWTVDTIKFYEAKFKDWEAPSRSKVRKIGRWFVSLKATWGITGCDSVKPRQEHPLIITCDSLVPDTFILREWGR